MTSLVRPSLASTYLPFTKFCSARSAISALHPMILCDELRRDGLSSQVIQLLSILIPTKSVDWKAMWPELAGLKPRGDGGMARSPRTPPYQNSGAVVPDDVSKLI